MLYLFHKSPHMYLIALNFNKNLQKMKQREVKMCIHTFSESHMDYSINELAVLMSAAE